MKKPAKRSLLALLAPSIALTLFMSACTGDPPPASESAPAQSAAPSDMPDSSTPEEDASEQITITMGIFETDNLTSEWRESWVGAFEAEHPNIKVEYMDIRETPPLALLATGSYPDIAWEAGPDYILEPSIFAPMPDDLKNQFEPGALAVNADGTYSLIPASKQLRMQAYYHKDMFEAAGITEAPATWDDLAAACEKLDATGFVPMICGGPADVWPMGGPIWIGAVNQILAAASPNIGVDLLNGTQTYAGVPGVAEQLTAWQDLVNKGYYHDGCLSFSYSQAAEEFANGAAAIMIDGSWGAATFDAAGNTEIGTFPVPNVLDTNTYCATVSYWGVSAASDKAHQDAAFELCRFVLGGNEDAYRTFLQADGLLSVTKTPVTYPVGPLATATQEMYQNMTLVPEISAVIGEGQIPYMDDFVFKVIENIYGGGDVAAGLQEIDAEFQRVLELSEE